MGIHKGTKLRPVQHRIFWSKEPEKLQFVRDRWEEGVTFTMISRALAERFEINVSRGRICGLITRLKWGKEGFKRGLMARTAEQLIILEEKAKPMTAKKGAEPAVFLHPETGVQLMLATMLASLCHQKLRKTLLRAIKVRALNRPMGKHISGKLRTVLPTKDALLPTDVAFTKEMVAAILIHAVTRARVLGYFGDDLPIQTKTTVAPPLHATPPPPPPVEPSQKPGPNFMYGSWDDDDFSVAGIAESVVAKPEPTKRSRKTVEPLNAGPALPVDQMVSLRIEVDDRAVDVLMDPAETTVVWWTQRQMAEALGLSVPTVNEHFNHPKRGLFATGELKRDNRTIRKFRIVGFEGGRQVTREVEHYSLNAFIRVGFRAQASDRALAFREKAAEVIHQYVLDGYALNIARLKNDPEAQAKLQVATRRLDERNAYQRILHHLAGAVDYDAKSAAAREMFRVMQSIFTFAATEHSPAEVIYTRVGRDKPNIGLQTWAAAGWPDRGDMGVGKNYLTIEELNALLIVCEIFDRWVERRRTMKVQYLMEDVINKFKALLVAMDYPIDARAQASVKHTEAVERALVERAAFIKQQVSPPPNNKSNGKQPKLDIPEPSETRH